MLQNINESSSGVQTINAHAGTGKTLLAGVLLEALVPHIRGGNSSVLILTPGRILRDELLESEDCVGPFANQGEVLWLGRPAEGKDSDRLYEAYVGRMVEEELAGVKARLNELGETMKRHHQGLMTQNLPWEEILYYRSVDWMQVPDIRADLGLFKAAAQRHMVQLIMTVVRPRAKIIGERLAKVRGCVSTCDA